MLSLSILLVATLLTQATASIEGAVVKMGTGEPIPGQQSLWISTGRLTMHIP